MKQEKRDFCGYLCLHVSVRTNSVRNLPNLVVLGGGAEWAAGLSLSRLGLMTVLKSPAQMVGTEWC